MAETTLDARGLKCPLPVLRAQKAMQQLAPGDVLRVLATDRGAIRDFDALCAARGHVLLERHERGEVLCFRIRKVRR